MHEQTQERRVVNAGVVNFLLEEIDETNFHACAAGNWRAINQLVDIPSTFGDLRSWITCAGACLESLEYQCPGLDDSDTGLEHAIYETDMPARILGVSDDQLDEMCGLPVGRVREKLQALLGNAVAA